MFVGFFVWFCCVYVDVGSVVFLVVVVCCGSGVLFVVFYCCLVVFGLFFLFALFGCVCVWWFAVGSCCVLGRFVFCVCRCFFACVLVWSFFGLSFFWRFWSFLVIGLSFCLFFFVCFLSWWKLWLAFWVGFFGLGWFFVF